MKPNLLIVEDDESMLCTLGDLFQQEGKQVFCAPNGKKAMEEFFKNQPDLVLLDIRLPDMDGLSLLKKMRETVPDLLVIIMTAYPEVPTAIQAMKSGAYDYINKPFELDELRLVIQKALETRQLKDEVKRLRKQGEHTSLSTPILGSSPAIRQLHHLIRMVADAPKTPVLLSGESGTGKELAANAIHYQSARANGALIKVNCSALPENLLEDELFGHERGAFTDAKETKKGLFELADGGTLFLDEIGEMTPSLQPKLLRILEGEPFRRVGGTREIKTDVRIIAATNRDILDMVEKNFFRQDLYFRLKVMEIRLPTLRERKEDIPLLANHFIHLHSQEMGRSEGTMTGEALELLMSYSWPGNVRELRNVIERAVILAQGKPIDREHLPLELCKSAIAERFKETVPVSMDLKLEDLEREYILTILKKLDGNKSLAAKRLGISRSTLIERLKRYH
ncbi:MAG: sigma-54 dependent transcriptional regulator [bacterium]